ncbi:biotin/lipoyl-containing protein, partial [Rhodococcus chondri]
GLDLVGLQLHIAAGGALDPEPPPPRGHSIEVRLYAEDPARDWQPQSGTVHEFAVPVDTARFSGLHESGIRVDSGIVDGSVVGVHYDPMLAKIISWAPDRTRAARMLAAAVAGMRLHGLHTNRDLLVNVLRHPAFLAGDTDTAFFDVHGLASLAAPLASAEAEALSALAAALADAAANRAATPVAIAVPSGWRNLPSGPQSKRYRGVHATHTVRYRLTRTGLLTELDGIDTDGLGLVTHTPDRVVLDRGGLRREFAVARYGETVHVDSSLGPVRLEHLPRFTDPAAQLVTGSLLAPMPGSVIRLGAEAGDTVTAGQPVLWLEAMKMEHTVTAPTAGTLTELNVDVGAQVAVGAVLAVVTPATDPSGEQT